MHRPGQREHREKGLLGWPNLFILKKAPLWTPLFATAAAVVTDGGGMLSHCAIVAREYGIPAIVGARQATTLIKDGATILVDGKERR